MMRILFLGEGSLAGPARYLAAVLKACGMAFDHRPDRARISKPLRRKTYDVIVLSDYRFASFTDCAREWLIGEVEKGTGLLMIGGWASFTGLVGGYAGTAIEKLLPVRCLKKDDRVQRATGAMFLPTTTSQKSFFPIVCGYHRAIPKPGTETPFVFRDLTYKNGRVSLGPAQPALVLGRAGRARTAAFLTDCAPHWAGGLVDWGTRRVRVKVGSDPVEVGTEYVRFFERLLRYLEKGSAGFKPGNFQKSRSFV